MGSGLYLLFLLCCCISPARNYMEEKDRKMYRGVRCWPIWCGQWKEEPLFSTLAQFTKSRHFIIKQFALGMRWFCNQSNHNPMGSAFLEHSAHAWSVMLLLKCPNVSFFGCISRTAPSAYPGAHILNIFRCTTFTSCITLISYFKSVCFKVEKKAKHLFPLCKPAFWGWIRPNVTTVSIFNVVLLQQKTFRYF